MRTITYSDNYELVINGERVKLPINTTSQSGCYVEILEALGRELVAMLSIHNKVLVIRFDIHLYEHTNDNRKITEFLKPLRRWIEREYHNSELGYLWVREHDTAKHQHYHVVVIVDGNKAKSSYKIIERAEHIASIKDFHIGRCKQAHTMVKRGDIDAFSKVFYRTSYLAKERTKAHGKGQNANNYSASRITANADKLPLVMPQFNRPVLELTLCEPMPPKKPKAKPLTKRTTTRRCTKAVNDAQLELDLMIA